MIPMTIAPPLREVAELKLNEFKQLKQDFKTRYGIGTQRYVNVPVRDRIAALVKDIQRFDSYLEDDNDLTIIARYTEQTESDGCMSDDKLLKFEEKVLSKLHKRMNCYDATSLHLSLMMEAMDAAQTVKATSPGLDALSLDDDYEVVDSKLENIWEKFETEAFTAKDVDTEALQTYLTDLMDDSGSLYELRNDMRRYGEEVLRGEADIDESDLEWCIMDLLHNDLISGDKRQTLESYIQNPLAIKELLGVLNMKSVSIWDWKKTMKGLSVNARKDSDGQYHVTIEEDLVDMLFLHCTAIGWAQKLKSGLLDYFRSQDLVLPPYLTADQLKEREFFLNMMPREPCPEESPDLFDFWGPSGPPPDWGVPHGIYTLPAPVRKRKIKKKAPRVAHDTMMMPPPPPPPMSLVVVPPPPPPGLPPLPPPPPLISVIPSSLQLTTVNEERSRIYRCNFFMSRLPDTQGCRPKVTPVNEVQANLIKTLAADLKVRTIIDGRVGCSVVNFDSLATALPHKVILVILKFLGVPEVIVNFFARFLSADLNIGPSVRGTRDRILTRACGVPECHGMELLFTEAVMFFAEMAVCKKTGLHLYRLGSRCYFVGSEEQNEQAMQELSIFSKNTKLEFDDISPGPERLEIGFLELSGSVHAINVALVEAYAVRAKKQLAAQNTVYDWVRVWNSSVGTYAAHLFGPLIDLFGKPHLEAVKAAYKKIFDIIFEGSSLTDHIKNMLRARSDFARNIAPLALEAFVYLPQTFGGIGVKNPLVSLNLARSIAPEPDTVLEDYRTLETQYYQTALSNWNALTPDHISKKLAHVFRDDPEAAASVLGSEGAEGIFFSQAALTRHRQYALFHALPPTLLHDSPAPPHAVHRIPYLSGLYSALLNAPTESIAASERLRDEVCECGPMRRWELLGMQDRWALQMYGEECLEAFGSLDVWCERYVPEICGMLLRGVDEVGEDDASSYMTSVP